MFGSLKDTLKQNSPYSFSPPLIACWNKHACQVLAASSILQHTTHTASSTRLPTQPALTLQVGTVGTFISWTTVLRRRRSSPCPSTEHALLASPQGATASERACHLLSMPLTSPTRHALPPAGNNLRLPLSVQPYRLLPRTRTAVSVPPPPLAGGAGAHRAFQLPTCRGLLPAATLASHSAVASRAGHMEHV